MAQTTGYIIEESTGEKILVLVRGKIGKKAEFRYFKRRHTGKDGNYFEDESIYLNDCPDKMNKLKAGEIITC